MVIQGLGFDQPCSGSLACGHKCPFPNHPPDYVHEYPLCFEQCRQRCSGCGMQSCQKLCYEACEPVCYETIQKHLPCGHKQTTLCYEPVEDTHCDARCNKELVCGHACIKPCSDDCMCDYAVMFNCTTCKKKTYQCSSLNNCTRKCDVKLSCGHQCSSQCGDHTMHSKMCMKPCSRPCQYCNKSTCTRKCGECQNTCPPCACRMQQIQLNCGHVTYGFAGNINTCYQDCALDLPCGHMCRKKCSEKCGPCEEPGIYPCKDCAAMYEGTCGGPCTMPCDELLPCGHPCGGSCGTCNGGLLHEKCSRACGRTLMCGHICNEPCHEVCPPCDQKCAKRCVHSKCDHPCWEDCVPCVEECPDRGCRNLCSSGDCDHAKSSIPCQEARSCGHKCELVQHDTNCAELHSPENCAQCIIEISEMFYDPIMISEDYDMDSMYVYIPDCGHRIEFEALDSFVRATMDECRTGEFKAISCPKCKTPMLSCLRYNSEFNIWNKKYATIKEKYREEMEKTINFKEVKQNIFEKLQKPRSFATKELDQDSIYSRINSTKLPNDARIILLQLDYLQRVDKSLEDIRSREIERSLFDFEEEILEQLQQLEEIIVKFASRRLRVLGELHTKAIEDIILKVEIFGNCYAYSTSLEEKYTGPTRALEMVENDDRYLHLKIFPSVIQFCRFYEILKSLKSRKKRRKSKKESKRIKIASMLL